MDLSIQTLSDIVGGRVSIAAMPPLGGVCEPVAKLVTDPQRVGPGDVLVVSEALRRRHPCCEFEAFSRGAIGAIGTSSQIEPPAGGFYLQVDDAAWALWQLASAFRANFEGQVIAVAGSVGKTTTAAMIASLLGLPVELHESPDEECSLAEQLLRLSNDAHFAIVEMRTQDCGDLEAALHLCCPHIAVVIDPEEFSETPLRERKRLWNNIAPALPDDGSLVIGPSVRIPPTAIDRVNAWSFGRDASCDVFATHVFAANGRLQFAVDGRVAQLQLYGRHFLDNALATWCVGRATGLCEETIAKRIARFATPRQRCEVIEARDVTFIDDTACRSAVGRRASLELLSTLHGGRHVVVCSDVNVPVDEQYRWGASLVEVAGADTVITIGDPGNIVGGAVDAGMPPSHCHRCSAGASSAQEISTFLRPGDIVLLTGVDAQVAQQVLALFQNTVSATTARAAAA